jgi:uncharacterized protein (UPF0333 family)
MTIVLVVVLVIVVAGVGTYVFVFSSSSGSGPTTTTTTSHTLTISTPTSGATSTSSAASTETTSSVTGLQSYKGNFTYIVPLGPFGINDSSGKPVEWNSTQTASGTFTFSVNPSTYLGSGSGQGSITVATRGYCTGSETVPYTFTVTATHPPGEDLEVAFDPPSPANVTVQLTCQGSTVGFNTANNPVTFLSVYPNLVTTASVPMTDSQVLTGGISYTVIIVATS